MSFSRMSKLINCSTNSPQDIIHSPIFLPFSVQSKKQQNAPKTIATANKIRIRAQVGKLVSGFILKLSFST